MKNTVVNNIEKKKKGFGLKAKLIAIFLLTKIIPVMLLAFIAWRQLTELGTTLRIIAVNDTSEVIFDNAVESVERMTTDMANSIADFLYQRDKDILFLAGLEPNENIYKNFIETQMRRRVKTGSWQLSDEEDSWVSQKSNPLIFNEGVYSDDFRLREGDNFEYEDIILYEEITYIDLEGNEQIKIVNPYSEKTNYPLNNEKKNISVKENTYIGSEDYFEKLASLYKGEIYVSDVIGAYVGTNYVGMYTPKTVAEAEDALGWEIEYDPLNQAYASDENPLGQQFEGIVRWATPVYDNNGIKTGYVTLALNHDHLMEFINHTTPADERYVDVPTASNGNYAFIWDYNCRIICHPKHHTIVGYNPETGKQEVPWLEDEIYYAWQESGIEDWTEFIKSVPQFKNQSRDKKLSSELEKAGLVAYDGRYLNNAPQCGRWQEITQEGTSGALYLAWEGVEKLTTFAPIPYYTGQYKPSENNGYSQRGFGFIVIGAELESFKSFVVKTSERLDVATMENLKRTVFELTAATIAILISVVFIAIWMASSITKRIIYLTDGISRFKVGERQFRFNSKNTDEIGVLADSFDEMADSLENSSKNPLAIIGFDNKIVYMNMLGVETCGKSALEEIIGMSYSEINFFPPNTKYCPIKALENGVEAEIYYDEQNDVYVKGSANYLFDDNSNKIAYIIERIDVSETERSKLETERQNALLDGIFSASPDLIWLIDTNGIYQTVNPRFASITGIAPENFAGKTARDIFNNEIFERIFEKDERVRQNGAVLYSEETITFADGHTETLDSVRTPIFNAHGKIISILGFARDVSARVEMEQKLRKTQHELEITAYEANRANEHKGEFLARMSHEIRTPMNAIVGLTDIMLKRANSGREKLTPEFVKECVEQVSASSSHLLGLINDVLDFSKIEAGKIELINESANLLKTIETATSIIMARCKEKDIEFITNFSTFRQPYFMFDSLRLRQVIINLLGNAVKFTPEFGKIEFTVEELEQKQDKSLIKFAVKDTGIGIEEEAMDSIFGVFEQGTGNVTKIYGGTGLGLPISNRILNIMGSEIKVKSQPGAGSEFYFSVWLNKAEEIDLPENEISDLSGLLIGKKALLVDDVDINRMIVFSMLEGSGLEIDEAEDGIDAVEKFSNSPVGTYDLIFMDIQMPGMNGYEAASAIRKLERADAAQTYIIALTANAFKEDIDKAIANGMNAHISKPVGYEKLTEVICKYLNS